jgi:acetylornithine deacetylase
VSFERNTFHREAVKTPSHEDVSEMRDLLVETLSTEQQDVDIDEAGNVIASRGTTRNDGPHLVLNTHLDTVPPHIPYEHDGDIVRGRGACDAKGPLAAFIDAFLSARITNGKLMLAVTPNEETSQFGGAHLGETLSADGYIVGEPTGLDTCIAAKGNFGGMVIIYGESAHASDPSDGVNAIRGVESVLDAIEQYDEQLGPGTHGLLGEPTLTPTNIAAGGPLNQVPDQCTISFDRRTVPPETIDEFLESLESYLDQRVPDKYGIEVKPAYPESPSPDAFAIHSDTELVQTLTDVSGGEIRSFGAATEASYFADDAPTVVFGPGVIADETGPVAHSDREYVKQSEIGVAADVVRETVETLLS